MNIKNLSDIMAELKISKIKKFLVENKISKSMPFYHYLYSYILKQYKKELNEEVTEIGDYSLFVGNVITASNKYKLKIGKFSSIATSASFILSSAHRPDFISTYPFIQSTDVSFFEHISNNHKKGILSAKGDITIGNDVWIGHNAIVLSGVNIGDGAVIGAGSVVTKDVSDYEIVVGNPARHLKYRFSKEDIWELKKIKWWDWPIEKIIKNQKLIESSNIKSFIKKFQE